MMQRLRKRQLRRTLNATDPTASIIVPAETMFVFNGTSADLAQQFYQRYQAGDSLHKLDIAHSKLPERVRARLATYDLKFKHLHSLLQRALLWDSGFVLSGNALVPILTANGSSMADIALSYDDFTTVAGCGASTCGDSGTAYRASSACSSDALAPVLKCAIDSTSSSSSGKASDDGTAIWATGGSAKAIPDLSLVRHTWQDAATQETHSVHAIHSMSLTKEPSTSGCAAGQPPSMIIPCASSSSANATTVWVAPAHGTLVTVWLEHARADKPGFSVYYTGLIVAAVVVGLVLVLVLCCKGKSRYKRRRQRREEAKMTSADPQALLESNTDGLEVSAVALTPVHAMLESDAEASASTNVSSRGSDAWTNVFVTSKAVASRRLRMDQLAFKHKLATGANGSEVWAAKYHGARVAVKRTVATSTSTDSAVATAPPAISAEIELLATLRHRHLVRFFGVAWDTPDSLCVVTEYARKGSLADVLSRSSEDSATPLAWPQLECIMVGVARAVAYLHSRESPVVHGDLCARNVLLVSHFEPKLTGIRGNSADSEATTLEGDVLALGVLFSELIALGDRADTMAAVREEHKDSDECATVCPQAIRDVVAQCMHSDPSARPRTAEVVRVLADACAGEQEVEADV